MVSWSGGYFNEWVWSTDLEKISWKFVIKFRAKFVSFLKSMRKEGLKIKFRALKLFLYFVYLNKH